MNRKELRALAIALLDDGDGINERAYDLLRASLLDNQSRDIVTLVESGMGRYYLPEEHSLEP